MKTYTKNEQRIFNKIAELSLEGDAANINSFCGDEMTAKEIRGVISSLVKKNKLRVNEDVTMDGVPTLWPVHTKHGPCFWTDCVAEGEEEFITDNEVAA